MRGFSAIAANLLLLAAATACGPAKDAAAPTEEESAEAKALLQGIWIDAETEEVSFRAEGDTIFYPDQTSQPAHFRIVNDSLELGRNRYCIVKQSEHNFWFRNQNGDLVKLTKSMYQEDTLAFQHPEPAVLNEQQVVKTDSVVNFQGRRYHWYIAINPTRYRVVRTSYNSDGVGVENVYYDNIIHVSLFQDANRLFSRDFNKQMYVGNVPESFLEQAVLGNMQYDHVDAAGFHFNATICIPDGASCYLVETTIGFDGQMSMKLLEY